MTCRRAAAAWQVILVYSRVQQIRQATKLAGLIAVTVIGNELNVALAGWGER